jgi:hypothetical protein
MAAEAGEAVLHITCTTLVTKPSSPMTGCSAVTEANGRGKGRGSYRHLFFNFSSIEKSTHGSMKSGAAKDFMVGIRRSLGRT